MSKTLMGTTVRPTTAHHKRLPLTPNQRSLLRELYTSISSPKPGYVECAWNEWIHKHLNNNSSIPSEGRYSIELLFSWSVWRLAVATSIPVVLSLIVGLWYQTLEPREVREDPTETAWVIATYIITAGACEYC